jgi:hypothetical protein
MHCSTAVEAANSAGVEGRVIVLRRALCPEVGLPVVREVEGHSQAVNKTA